VASRLSTNDAMINEDIGDLEQECGTLAEAQAIAQRWHTERYSDNDAEFDQYGGNTADREAFEHQQWSGKFKCKRCGKLIVDSYTIQGILHHGCEIQCQPSCEQT
jgi:hypothetical protein